MGIEMVVDETRKSLDKSNMYKVILDFPKQFRIGLKAVKNIRIKSKRKFKNVIICGMGGSALPGDILVTLQPLDVFMHKSYGLPVQATNQSLIICISYSGNTEETISAYEEAVKRKFSVVGISTGGMLEELCKKNNTPFVKIPLPYIPPRLALGYQFAALVKILSNCSLIDKPIPRNLLSLEKTLKPKKYENFGKEIAKKLFGKIPIVYLPKKFREISLIWKNSLNETAKIIAIANYFSELNHNEIVSFWRINQTQISNEKLHVIIIRDREDYPKILKQMDIAADILKREGVGVDFIDMEEGDVLKKTFSAIILGFWVSYWLALVYGIDPTPTEAITEIKQRLRM